MPKRPAASGGGGILIVLIAYQPTPEERELTEFVESMVASGMYSSASEVVRAGLRMLCQTEELHLSRLGELRADVATGLEEVLIEIWLLLAAQCIGAADALLD